MKRRRRHRGSCQVHRRDNGPGRQYPCSPNLYDDVLQDSLLDLGRIFERRRPARELRRASHARAPRKVIELHDRAVNVIRQVITRLADGRDRIDRLVDCFAELIVDDLEAEAS